MRIVILEDEAPARRLLERLVHELAPKSQVIASLDSLESARELFARKEPVDLVLSDIRLADGNALTLFEADIVQAPVIFITAYDTWLAQAFHYLSIDYLLKPVDRQAFRAALGKVETLRRHFGRAEAGEASRLLHARPRDRVLVRHRGEVRVLRTADVAFFRADDKLTLAVDREGTELIIDRTLSELAAELDPACFFRANRAFLVNVDAIEAFRSNGRGRLLVRLTPAPQQEVIVSQENAAAFKAFVVGGAEPRGC